MTGLASMYDWFSNSIMVPKIWERQAQSILCQSF